MPPKLLTATGCAGVCCQRHIHLVSVFAPEPLETGTYSTWPSGGALGLGSALSGTPSSLNTRRILRYGFCASCHGLLAGIKGARLDLIQTQILPLLRCPAGPLKAMVSTVVV